jgi:hypothetical protein
MALETAQKDLGRGTPKRMSGCRKRLLYHLRPAFADYVPAGITELIMKQQEGWSYVRP